MYFQTSTASVIINKIEDILFIELTDSNGKEAEYCIQSENEKVIRRGRFKGSITQLCLSHLATGCYKLFLSSGSADTVTYPFEKQNSSFLVFSR